LEDVYGDLKEMTGAEIVTIVAGDMITGAKCLTVVECMKGKEVKGLNGVRNQAKKGKQERCVIMRGHS
jgi:hypothetical protein